MNTCTEILLVEDDPGDVRLALEVLRELHMAERCVVVNDGEEAIDFLHARGAYSQRAPGVPRVIVLDLKMPRVDGFEFLEQIKVDPRFKLIPVVVLTSSREERDVQRAYGLGVNSYAVKSINFAEYRERLRTLVKYWADVNEQPVAAASLENG
jgi:CheY-like chemotaxis protein